MEDGYTNNGHDRQSDLAVMDANEFKQKHRLKNILETVDDVQDAADNAWNAYVEGEISREARNITIQRAVTNAIRECYKLLLDHHRTVKKSGDAPDRYWQGIPKDHLGSIELDGEQVEVIQGLRDFLEAPTFFERTFTEEITPRNMPKETVAHSVEKTMPERVSYRAYLRLKEFLDDIHDMEISFEELDDKLADEKPATVEIPENMDLSNFEDMSEFDGPVDNRAVSKNDD